MRVEQYTPDAICQALGLGRFALEPSVNPVFRLLLTPSFNPELCVTFAADGDKTVVDVRTFAGQFWHAESPSSSSPMFAERIATDNVPIEQLADRFLQIAPQIGQEASALVVICDGMGVAATARSGAREATLDCNVGESATLGAYIADLLPKLYALCPAGHCCNAIADAGSYIDLQLQRTDVAPVDTAARIMVLGNEQGRAEVVKRLSRERNRRSDEPS